MFQREKKINPAGSSEEREGDGGRAKCDILTSKGKKTKNETSNYDKDRGIVDKQRFSSVLGVAWCRNVAGEWSEPLQSLPRSPSLHTAASKLSFGMELFSPKRRIKVSRFSRPPWDSSGPLGFVIVPRCIISVDTGCWAETAEPNQVSVKGKLALRAFRIASVMAPWLQIRQWEIKYCICSCSYSGI